MPSPSSSVGSSAVSGQTSAFNPHSLYSSGNASAGPTPSKAALAAPSGEVLSTKKKQTKRRKVNLACIYCRRSHMTCDEGRPCQRCIKRDIGHLCHDETAAKPPHPAAPASTGKGDGIGAAATAAAKVTPRTPSTDGIVPSASDAALKGPDGISESSGIGGGIGLAGSTMSGGSNGTLPYFGGGLQLNPTLGRSAGASNTAFIGGSTGPYSSASPMSSLNTDSRTSPFAQDGIFRDSVSPLKNQGQDQSQGQGQGQGPLAEFGDFGAGQDGNPSGSLSTNNGSTTNNGSNISATNGFSQYDWGLGSNSGLGGAGWLGLGGGPGGFEGGGQGFSGDSAGGNEFTLLSEFLESLDGSVFGGGVNPLKSQNQGSQIGGSTNNSGGLGGTSTSRGGSRRNTISGKVGGLFGDIAASGSRASLPPPNSQYDPAEVDEAGAGKTIANTTTTTTTTTTGTPRGIKRPRGSSFSAVPRPEDGLNGSSSNAGPYPASLRGASKTERFFLTAADQKDGPRDERLSRVIQAKYEAGLLRPYNHVNGYARLNRWMERNVSQASKRRILKPLSVFRPAFRAVAQSLTNIDLIFIEEAFERLLLDYDRVFSTQGIPACLWRRTGEIYKGNKEFAELVGVPIESLREGRLCIYELMTEESAVNYWEKYGAVSFDPGQKAVLTSCVLRTKNKAMIAGSKDKPSSAKLIAAQLPKAHGGGGSSSGQTTPTLAPQSGPGAAAGLFPLTPLDGGTKAASGGEVKGTSRENNNGGDKGDAGAGGGEPSRPRTSSISGVGGASTTNGGAAGGLGGTTTPTGGKDAKDAKVSFVHCCFSFTIRRDQWNIPTMIVGNFLPTNPP